MKLDAITSTPTIGDVSRAHESLNAAYNAVSAYREAPGAGLEPVDLAHDYVHEARGFLSTDGSGKGATDAARLAARDVLPRLDHATKLLAQLRTTQDAEHLMPLLDELGASMDRVEQVLAGAGWD